MIDRVAAAVLLPILLVGCRDSAPVQDLPAEPLPTADAELVSESGDTVRLTVEIAATPAARAYGLMDRDSLGTTEGMLFVFDDDRPAETAFYMYRTRIPLDIAFIDAAGRIVSMHTMQPCSYPVPEFCEKYAAGAPYRYALEANADFFVKRGISVGTLVEWRSVDGPG